MGAAGLGMLVAVGAITILSGLPVVMVLIGVATLFATAGMALGVLPIGILYALPSRVIGLLEHDLLQALPLYVLMGALLDRLPLADALYRAGVWLFGGGRAAPRLAAIGLGAMLAPMNGSVGASVATLTRIVLPKLTARGASGADGLSIVCVASTLGVVVPPSLVLILLGDAMLRAHTEALNKTRVMTRIINTQDVFRGALAPAAIFLALCLLAAWWNSRRNTTDQPRTIPVIATAGDKFIGLATLVFIVGLLASVAAGYLYAVEAAAMGAFTLFAFGLVTRSLDGNALRDVLRTTMATTGALFALLVAATSFTLVLRGYGTDRLVDELVSGLPGGGGGAMAVVLLALALCAFVLDAFEIIFVVIPILMPPLLALVPDAVWVATLTLLVLQASFLIPPFGYAIMMARGASGGSVDPRALSWALMPFLLAQLVVLGLTLAVPRLAHLAEPASAADSPVKPVLSDEEVRKRFESIVPDTPQSDEPVKIPAE